MKFAVLVVLSLLLPFHSCSTHKNMGKNQRAEGHFRLYTYPENPGEYFFNNKDEERYKEVVFAVLNDTGASPAANIHKVIDPSQGQSFNIKIGGVSGYKAYLKILREKFPGKVQTVSSGSLFNPNLRPKETIFYADYLGIDVAGLSKSDFSLPIKGNYLQSLDKQIQSARFKTVSSNIFNLEAGGDFELENILQSVIVDVDGLKIGYISMIAPSMAKEFDSEKLNKIYFQPMAAKIITLTNELRRKGANMVALMVANGVDCTSQQSQAEKISQFKVNFMPSNEKVCDLYENELALTLQKLPPNMVDIVFTNGMDSKVANIISGYPVLQSFPGGEHLSWAKLVYDTKFERVVHNKTQVMQPVQLCHEFFAETEDCYVKETLRNIELEPAVFLGEKVEIQPIPTRK